VAQSGRRGLGCRYVYHNHTTNTAITTAADENLVVGRAAEAKAMLHCAHALHPTMETGRQLEDAHAELVSPVKGREALVAANWNYKMGCVI
jgi:hypothetical protein